MPLGSTTIEGVEMEKLFFMMGAKNFSKPLDDACARWGITNGADKARFVAQLSVESGGFKRLTEGVGYSAQRLVQVFRTRNGLTPAIAQRLVNAGPKAVFNFIYGEKWGRENLGNIEPDDGWNFRGRGLIMTTGRDNYRATSLGCWGDERLLDDPDQLLLPENAANAAAWFWYSRKLNGVTDIREVTRRINGGSMHLPQRIAETTKAMDLLNFLTQN